MTKVLVNTYAGEKEMYIDGYLKSNLDALIRLVDKKWDGIGFVCGYEGDGKTTIAKQICAYLDPTFCLDRVVFEPKDFLSICMSATKKQAILFDESYLTFNTRSWSKKITNMIISALTMIRKKQLYIIIVAPTFFDIQKYIAIHRSRFLIHVYADGETRGFFRFFNRIKKHNLYISGKKWDNMYSVKPNFTGRFTNFSPLNEIEYENKKSKSFEQFKIDSFDNDPNRKGEPKKRHFHLMEFVNYCASNNEFRVGALKRLSEKYFGVNQRTLFVWRTECMNEMRRKGRNS